MADSMVPQRVEVHAVRPTATDLRKLEHHRATMNAQVPDVSYLVKIYVTLPPADAAGYELWLGDEQVRKYTEFSGGIYFKVTNPEQLAALRGKKVRFKRPSDTEFIDSNVSVPVAAATPRVAAGAVGAARSATALPAEEDLLRE